MVITNKLPAMCAAVESLRTPQPGCNAKKSIDNSSATCVGPSAMILYK